MINDIRTNELCYSHDADLEIEAQNQTWDKETIKELKELKVYYNNDSCHPVHVDVDNRSFRIGEEDDGCLFFDTESWLGNVDWIPGLIKNLQTAYEEVSKQRANRKTL